MIQIKKYKELYYFYCYETTSDDKTYITSETSDASNYYLLIIYKKFKNDYIPYWKQINLTEEKNVLTKIDEDKNIESVYNMIQKDDQILYFHHCKEYDTTEQLRSSSLQKLLKFHQRKEKINNLYKTF